MTNTVGLIGIGLMGTAFAHRLLGAGYSVVGFDVDAGRRAGLAEMGGEPVESVAQVAQRCNRIVLSVVTVGQVEQVVEADDGLLANFPPADDNRIALCTVTCEPDRIEALAARSPSQGLTILDTPASGTSKQVFHGEALGLISGDEAAIAAASEALDAIYPRRCITGPAGSGTRTKLAINHVLGLNRLALAEGLVFAERLGLDPGTFLKVARQSAAYSQIMDIKGDKMVQGDFEPVSKVSPHLKDVRIMLEEARRSGQRLPMAEVLVDVLESCEQQGEGDYDNAIMINEIRRRSQPAVLN